MGGDKSPNLPNHFSFKSVESTDFSIEWWAVHYLVGLDFGDSTLLERWQRMNSETPGWLDQSSRISAWGTWFLHNLRWSVSFILEFYCNYLAGNLMSKIASESGTSTTEACLSSKEEHKEAQVKRLAGSMCRIRTRGFFSLTRPVGTAIRIPGAESSNCSWVNLKRSTLDWWSLHFALFHSDIGNFATKAKVRATLMKHDETPCHIAIREAGWWYQGSGWYPRWSSYRNISKSCGGFGMCVMCNGKPGSIYIYTYFIQFAGLLPTCDSLPQKDVIQSRKASLRPVLSPKPFERHRCKIFMCCFLEARCQKCPGDPPWSLWIMRRFSPDEPWTWWLWGDFFNGKTSLSKGLLID